jgi:general secretion pathway protein J
MQPDLFPAPPVTAQKRADAQRRRMRGFTLIELLVALVLMAVMATLSWRGLDAMQRHQSSLALHSQEVLSLQNGLAQWTADLEAIETQPGQNSMDWDGRALRLLRRGSQSTGEGLVVVAWAQGQRAQGNVWLRWSSPPLTNRAQMLAAWSQAAIWAQNPGDAERLREVIIAPLSSWQIVYFRGGAWSNPLSSGDQVKGTLTAPAGAAALPDGVRLVLTLPKGGAVSGTITRDWSRSGLGGS